MWYRKNAEKWAWVFINFDLICVFKIDLPMRKLFISIILFFVFTAFSSAQLYSKFFSDEACRVDFQLCGNSITTSAYIDIIKQEPFWGGRRNQLSVDMNLGQNRFQVRDSATNQLIYCDGFSTLYYEWQTTAEAKALKEKKNLEWEKSNSMN